MQLSSAEFSILWYCQLLESLFLSVDLPLCTPLMVNLSLDYLVHVKEPHPVTSSFTDKH